MAYGMLAERGNYQEEADGLDLSWGNNDTIIELVEKIAYRRRYRRLIRKRIERSL